MLSSSIRSTPVVVWEAYVHGVSTRKVDDLLRALGLDGMSKSEVGRVCAALDAEVAHGGVRAEGCAGPVRLRLVTHQNGRPYYQAKTTLQTIDLLAGPEGGSN